MRRILLLTLLTCCFITSKSQNLSFSCPRDTILGCNSACFTVKGKFPDLRSLATDYTYKEVTPISQCRPYVPPDVVGPSANLTIDDRYSSVIPLPFSFPFYGTAYNSIIVSTNGYVSFDVSLAGTFSEWDLTPGDVPNTSYDRALIMGPWHDLDPGVTNSPTQQVKYNTIGTAPNRKWVLSFYKVPLFQAACNPLIENTHQIILHESTGVIEVFIKDKQICPSWNNGKAMVGLQDFTQTKGIMPAGRRATDPSWGSIGMNETWRFIPSQGATLYRSVVLLDGTGTVVATGDTTRIDANTFEATFPNICPPSGNSIYVIKTTYQKIDDPTPGAIIFSLDTINVLRQAALPVTATMTPTTCGSNTGTVTVTVSGGVGPYQYSIDGGPLQASNVFTGLTAGAHTVFAQDAGGCNNTITITVTSVSSLPSTNTVTATSCPTVNNGTIAITPTAGVAPYTYTLNGGPSQASNIFAGLAPGAYTIVFTDNLGCTGTLSVTVAAGTSITSTSITNGTSCAFVNNGSTTITPTSGIGPYTFSIDGGPSQASGLFTGLAPGTHNVTITDVNGCTGTRSVFIATGVGVTTTFTATGTSCPGVNNGTITMTPTNGTAPYTYSLNGGPFQASNIFTGVPAGFHTITIKDATGCTGTKGVNINIGIGLTASATFTATSCPGINDATITTNPNTGTPPFTFSLDGGPSQASNIFSGVSAGSHTVTFTDFIGCTGSSTLNVGSGPFLTATFTTFNPPCSNINNGTITIVPGGAAPYSFTLTGPGGPFTQAAATFTNLSVGTYNFSFTDGNGCNGTGGPVVLTTNSPISTTVTLTEPLCNGNANGIISLVASGGVAPYEYSLSPFTTYQPTGVFNGLTTGTYTFRIKDNAGCIKDTTISLGEPTLLTASAISPTPSTCFGNDGTITVTGSGGTPVYQYSIDNGTTYQGSNTFIAPAVGAYPNIKVKDANGCIANTSTFVILVDAMFLSLGPDTTICVGKSVKLLPQSNPGTSVFNWRPLDSLITLPATIDTPIIRNVTVTPVDTATYILRAMWGACSREDTITVNILHKPIAHAGSDTAICNQTYAILRGSATNLSGSVNFAWAPTDSLQNPAAAVTVASPDSTQLYTLTVTDNYGCSFSVTDQVLITVQPPVPAFAGNDTIAIKGVPHQLFGSGGADYLWNPSAPLNFSTAQNPLATLTNDQLFILKVTDIAGCIGYDTVFVQAYDGPIYYVPNAFSPNGDGLNDIFRAIPVGISQTDYFRVFNRFGQLLFETNQWLKGWDGKYKGKPQPLGVYVWVVKGIDKNGRTVEMKGTVILVQ